MANKLFLVCTSLALCFLLTNASIYRTIVEVDEDDVSNPSGPFSPKQKCQKEFQQAQHLRACQQFIQQQARRQSRGWPSLDDEFDFEDEIENRRGGQGQGQGQKQSPLLQQCCNELRQEDQVCVCPTLKQAARAVSGQGRQQQQQQQGQHLHQIYQTAKHLPNICNIPQVGVCPFRIPSSPYSPY